MENFVTPLRGQRRGIGVAASSPSHSCIRRYRRMGFKSVQNVYRMRIYFAIIAVVWFDIPADLIKIWPDLDGVIVERMAWPCHMVGVKSKFIDVRRGVFGYVFLL